MTTPTPEPNSEQPQAGKPSDSANAAAGNSTGPDVKAEPLAAGKVTAGTLGDVGAKPTDDKPLGPNGEKALQAEREAREELEKRLKPLEKLAEALGGKSSGDTKTDLDKLTERMSELEKTAGEERAMRLRLEVAGEKGLTPQQAARLQGATREELAADADALLALFPQAASDGNGQGSTGGRPKPDPSQGKRGTGSDIDARIADAESKGDVKAAIALKNQKLLASTNQ